MQSSSKFIRKYKELIISVSMILISIFGTIFAIVPVVQKVISIRENSIEISKSIQVLRTKINILESKDVNTYRDQFSQLLSAVPGDKSLPTVFTTLDALSAQSGVTLTEFSLGKIGSIASDSGTIASPEEKLIGSNLLPFTITVNGSYDQIYAFLSQVNNVRRFFRVKNFAISFADTSDISVHVGMDAFYAPVLTAIGAVESPLDPLSQQEEALIVNISQMPYLSQIPMGQETGVKIPDSPKANLFSP
jgi:Tfp pilus assembly protein PilO